MPGSVASGCAQEVGGSHFRTLSLLLIVLWDPQTKAILAAQARPRRGVAGGRSSRNHGGSHVSKLPSRTYWYFGEDRKPGLKKKKKKAVPLERARWRESIKMTPARLHPREHPVGPKCVSSQIDACPSGLRFADWQTPLHTRFGRHSIHAPSGPGLGESMQALVLTVL